jgi:hypothetical protein
MRDQGKSKNQKQDSEVHVREITSNGFHGKALVCRSAYDHEHELPTAIPSGGGHDSRYIRSLHRPVTAAAAGSFTAFI